MDEKSDNIRDLIERNKKNWEKNDIQEYSFSYNKTVGDSEIDDVHVLVIQGEIDSVSIEGVVVDSSDGFLTIDRLYSEIIKNFERDDRGSFQVNFNDEFSYPLRYRMLPGETTEGRGVVVRDFNVLGDDE